MANKPLVAEQCMQEFDPECERHFQIMIVKLVDPGCTIELQIEICKSGKVYRFTSTDNAEQDDAVFATAVLAAFKEALAC